MPPQLNADVLWLVLLQVAAPGLLDGVDMPSDFDTEAWEKFTSIRRDVELQLLACAQVSRQLYSLTLPLLWEDCRTRHPELHPFGRCTHAQSSHWLAALRTRPELASLVRNLVLHERTSVSKIVWHHLSLFSSLEAIQLSLAHVQLPSPAAAGVASLRPKPTSLILHEGLWQSPMSLQQHEIGPRLLGVLDLSRLKSLSLRAWDRDESRIFEWASTLPPTLTKLDLRSGELVWDDLRTLLLHHGRSLLKLCVGADLAFWIHMPPDQLPALADACPLLRAFEWKTRLAVFVADADDPENDLQCESSGILLSDLLSAGHPMLEEMTLRHARYTSARNDHDPFCEVACGIVADALDAGPSGLPSLRSMKLPELRFDRHLVSPKPVSALETLGQRGVALWDGQGERWTPASACMSMGLGGLFAL